MIWTWTEYLQKSIFLVPVQGFNDKTVKKMIHTIAINDMIYLSYI